MSKKTGLLLNVSGIQKYIFGTNKLKQNAGASWIVEHILTEKYLGKDPLYSGGGNALLDFDNEDSAKAFAREWSLKVLKEFPGLQPMTGLYNGEYSDDNFGEFLRDCRKAMAKTKALHQTQTELSRYGVTAECIYTGGSANVFKKNKYVSDVAVIKEKDKIFDNSTEFLKMKTEMTDINFPYELTEIGGKTNDNYRSGNAVVHIDGNEMGSRFQKQKSLKDYQSLSGNVEKWVQESVSFVAKEIKKLLDETNDKNEKFIKKDLGLADSNIFPFRPIIIGGDDVTFVCNSGLGLLTAKLFLDKFKQLQIDAGKTQNEIISACAGVAFVKPSFPFAQAYELAQDLCGNAKKRFRNFMSKVENKENYEEPSFIDFHSLQSGIIEPLEIIRKNGFELSGDSLLGRPFGIGKGSESFDFMINEANNIKKWSKNKIKDLREVVYKGKGAEELFFTHLKNKNKEFNRPKRPKAPRDNFGNPTYLDYCEFLDIVPESLLDIKYWEI